MRLRCVFVVLAVALTGCSGGGADDPPAADPTAARGRPSAAADLVVSGEPVAFEPATGVDVTVPVGDDGACELPHLSFDDQPAAAALCGGHFSGAGGDFIVATVGRAVDRYDVGVLCSGGGDDYHLTAAVIGSGTPVIQRFEFAELGEVAGVVLFEGLLAEAKSAPAVLVWQPEGADCPQFHGVGEVAADLVTEGGLNEATFLGYRGAGGNSATCTRVVDGAFVTEPAAGESCPGHG
jgi:hypothetical protein